MGCLSKGNLTCLNGGHCSITGHCECIDGFSGLRCGKLYIIISHLLKKLICMKTNK